MLNTTQPIMKDGDKKLGDKKLWASVCKTDRQGKPREVVGCSSVVVMDNGK